MASQTRVPNSPIKSDAETGVSGVKTAANDNSEGPIVIIVDSIIKDIIPEKISAKPVKKYKFAGKTTEEIPERLDSIRLKESTSHIIIHVWTICPMIRRKLVQLKLENSLTILKFNSPNL